MLVVFVVHVRNGFLLGAVSTPIIHNYDLITPLRFHHDIINSLNCIVDDALFIICAKNHCYLNISSQHNCLLNFLRNGLNSWCALRPQVLISSVFLYTKLPKHNLRILKPKQYKTCPEIRGIRDLRKTILFLTENLFIRSHILRLLPIRGGKYPTITASLNFLCLARLRKLSLPLQHVILPISFPPMNEEVGTESRD